MTETYLCAAKCVIYSRHGRSSDTTVTLSLLQPMGSADELQPL